LRNRALHDDPQKVKIMSEKKSANFDSPNVNKMQAVEIDHKTTIYIAIGADPVEAKKRYLYRINPKTITLS
jgi:hypothetical protein